MVCHPEDYPWSSYSINGNGQHSKLIAPHWSYVALAETKGERLATYTRLFDYPVEESMLKRLSDATNGNYALGDDRFEAEIELAVHRRVTPARAGRPRKCD